MNVYRPLEPIDRQDALEAMRSGDTPRVVEAILRTALHDSDAEWVTDQALALTDSPDADVRGAAATALGHIARIHGAIDRVRVLPALHRLLADPATAGRADDALDDISMFAASE